MIGLVNVYKKINHIKENQQDNTFKTGRNCIDIAMHACRRIECVDSYQLTKCDEVIINDYRECIVNLAIERFCNCRLNEYERAYKK